MFIKRGDTVCPRSQYHSVCSLGGKFLVASGGGSSLSTSELYHIALNQWIELPNMRNGRMFHSSCGFNDRAVYVFFGFNQSKVNSIERFDLDHRDWTIINTNYLSLRHTNFYVQVAQKDKESILILGGYDA